MTTASALRAVADLLDAVPLPEPTNGYGMGVSVHTGLPGARLQGCPAQMQALADHLGVTLTYYGHTDGDGNRYTYATALLGGHFPVELVAVTPPAPLPEIGSGRCTAHPDREAVGGQVGGDEPPVQWCQECMDAVYEDAL